MLTVLGMIAMPLLGVSQPVEAQKPPYALVTARVPGQVGELAPLALPVDFDELAEALATPELKLRDPIIAAVADEDGRLRRVPVQFDPHVAGGHRGTLTMLLPAAPSAQRVRVYFGPAAPGAGQVPVAWGGTYLSSPSADMRKSMA